MLKKAGLRNRMPMKRHSAHMRAMLNMNMMKPAAMPMEKHPQVAGRGHGSAGKHRKR